MNTCCSFAPMQRQLAITSSSFPLSHALNARPQRRNGCQPMHVKLSTNVRLWLYIAAEVRELLRVLFIRFCSVSADLGRTTSTKLRASAERETTAM